MSSSLMNRFQVARFLRMQPWLAELPPPAQESVIRASYTVHGKTGDVMLPWQERSEGWYAVLSGFVKLQSRGHGDRASAFLALTGGEWFGEDSVMKQEPRHYDVVALRATELLCLPRAKFEELLATNLPFSQAVIRHMNLRLGQSMAIIESQRLGDLEQRLALYLSPMFWHGLRRLNLSQKELGILAGMSRQTVNHVLQSLEQRGLVCLKYGRVVSVDQAAIERLLCGATAHVEAAGSPAQACHALA